MSCFSNLLFHLCQCTADVGISYTRSTSPARGQKPEVLETKNEISHEFSKTIRASDEGVYEVVSIRDRYCSFATQKAPGKPDQKLLMNR